MLNIRSSIRTSFLSLAVFLLSLGIPLIGLASVSADEPCVAPSSSESGVRWPTGSDASTFVYQCDGPNTGSWTNAYYKYDPATSSRTPLYNLDYKYDCTSGTWSVNSWDYSAADHQYHQNRVAASNPGGATNCPVTTPTSPSGGSAAGAGTSTTNQAAGGANTATAGTNTTSNTGPGSNSSTNTSSNNTLNLNNNTTASMNNTISGVATSGSSLVLGNTSAGGAATGNVQDIANIVNMLQSSSNALGNGSNVVTFTDNIDGDVTGDLLLDPSQLVNVQNATSNTNLTNNVTINNSTSAAINNNIDLAAQSGNATVTNNTAGGDATTGAAQAIANIVNSINSALMAGQSFIGTININGNLNGDILLPDNFIDQLLAANVPTVTISAPASTNTSNTSATNNTTVTNTNGLGITNNVHTTAASGSANTSNNTSSGNAASGNGTTNITAFNLTGSDVIGANDLLVFVNAPGGKWVGVIVNAPAGTTAASLGGGITQNTQDNTSATNNETVNNATKEKINNNVNVDAKSGNATVTSNTKGGNANSGNADTRVNLANIENSKLTLTGWLGILFINVFGSWNGSFGVNTDAGNPRVAPTVASNGAVPTSTASLGKVFRFVPHSNGRTTVATYGGSDTGATATTISSSSPDSTNGAVLAARTITDPTAPSPPLQTAHRSLAKTFGIISACVIGYILADALYSRRQRLHKSQS